MQRKALLTLAIALAMTSASTAFAQDDDLSGVTLRVLDDVGDIDAVVLAIDRERDGTEGADAEHRDGDREGEDRDEGARDDDRDDDVLDGEDRDGHDELEDDDHLERGEGGLEDHDVERDRVTEHPDEPVEPVEP